MTIDDLAIFVDVARRGSFASVARRRDLDPSSVSRTIATLEDELGVRLFMRNTRRLALTEAGAVYLERVEALVDELDRARYAARDVTGTPSGLLRIGAPVSFGERNIVPLLPVFARAHPQMTFDLLLTDVVLDLVLERIDVAIRVSPLFDSTLIAHRLAPLESVICASPDYLARHGVPRDPADLAEHRLLALDHLIGFDGVWRFARGGKTVELKTEPLVRSSNANALAACARAAMGITIQARWIVGPDLAAGALVPVLPDWTVSAANHADAGVWALYPSRTYLPLKVRTFVAFLEETFRERPPWELPTDTVPGV